MSAEAGESLTEPVYGESLLRGFYRTWCLMQLMRELTCETFAPLGIPERSDRMEKRGIIDEKLTPPGEHPQAASAVKTASEQEPDEVKTRRIEDSTVNRAIDIAAGKAAGK